MGVIHLFKRSMVFEPSTRRYILENRNVHINCCDNLRSCASAVSLEMNHKAKIFLFSATLLLRNRETVKMPQNVSDIKCFAVKSSHRIIQWIWIFSQDRSFNFTFFWSRSRWISSVKKKKIPWSESASELFWPSDSRLSAKWFPTVADRGCHVVSVTSLRPYSRFSRQEPLLFYQAAPQLYSRGWVDPVPYSLLFFLVVPGIEPRPPDL
jgi:hypothetical protein